MICLYANGVEYGFWSDMMIWNETIQQKIPKSNKKNYSCMKKLNFCQCSAGYSL